MSGIVPPPADPIPAFAGGQVPGDLREAISRAVSSWLLRTPSPHTRKAYEHDLNQFLSFAGIAAGAFEHLPQVRPEHVSRWRDQLAAGGQTNSTIRRKLTALRSLFSYLGFFAYPREKVYLAKRPITRQRYNLSENVGLLQRQQA